MLLHLNFIVRINIAPIALARVLGVMYVCALSVKFCQVSATKMYILLMSKVCLLRKLVSVCRQRLVVFQVA